MVVKIMNYRGNFRIHTLIVPDFPRVLVPKVDKINITIQDRDLKYSDAVYEASKQYKNEDCQLVSVAVDIIKPCSKRIGSAKLIQDLESFTPVVTYEDENIEDEGLWEITISDITQKQLEEKIKSNIMRKISKDPFLMSEKRFIYETQILTALKKYGWISL